ncbi:MAG TPA: pirin family protein [Xanthomonadales bacterium]|nr:pirin family protein [Xanthomonadales bacterium]
MTLIIKPNEKDLGEFTVRRSLPHTKCRSVGPFVFWDHFGPAEFPPGKGIQVRPHPHIGLATVTYLFEGEIIHRDSLGHVQAIRPGAVNLMTAGRGIVHSERAGDDLDQTSRMHGLQIWLALPDADEECEPGFTHYSAEEIPCFEVNGIQMNLVMGSAFGHQSPVSMRSETLYLDCRIPAGDGLEVPADWQELAVYVVEGEARVGDVDCPAGAMAILNSASDAQLRTQEGCHAVILGGEPLGKRTVWWNFVSSSHQRIEKAKRDWAEGRFDPVPGETEFIPLPED